LKSESKAAQYTVLKEMIEAFTLACGMDGLIGWAAWYVTRHGHISLVFAPGLPNRLLRWLTPRLGKSVVPAQTGE